MDDCVAMERIERDAAELAVAAESLRIENEEQFRQGGELVIAISRMEKEIKNTFSPVIKKAHEAYKAAHAAQKKHLDPLDKAKVVLRSRLASFQAEKARCAEEERRRQAEKAMLEAQDRRRKELEELRRKAKEEAKAAPREERAAIRERMKLEMEIIRSEPLRVEEPEVESPPKIEGVSFRKDWDFEIEDEGKLPRKFLVPDLKAIRRVVKALGSKAEIPGVRIFERTTTVTRS